MQDKLVGREVERDTSNDTVCALREMTGQHFRGKSELDNHKRCAFRLWLLWGMTSQLNWWTVGIQILFFCTVDQSKYFTCALAADCIANTTTLC